MGQQLSVKRQMNRLLAEASPQVHQRFLYTVWHGASQRQADALLILWRSTSWNVCSAAAYAGLSACHKNGTAPWDAVYVYSSIFIPAASPPAGSRRLRLGAGYRSYDISCVGSGSSARALAAGIPCQLVSADCRIAVVCHMYPRWQVMTVHLTMRPVLL